MSARELLAGTMVVAVSMVLSTGARTQEGLQRISEANLKHGRQTKDKLAAQRHAAEVGRRVMGELKRIEGQIVDAGRVSGEKDGISGHTARCPMGKRRIPYCEADSRVPPREMRRLQAQPSGRGSPADG